MAEMTSRERVWAALNHQEPDRVPLDVGGGGSTTLVVEALERLHAHWGLGPREPRIMSKAFRLALPGRGHAGPPRLGHPVRLRQGLLADAASDRRSLDVRGCVGRHLAKGAVPGRLLLGAARPPARRGHHRGPRALSLARPLDPALTAGLAEEVRALHGSPYALMADGGFKSFWELGFMLRGLEQLLMDLLVDPELRERAHGEAPRDQLDGDAAIPGDRGTVHPGLPGGRRPRHADRPAHVHPRCTGRS